jgi:hypothetical protein
MFFFEKKNQKTFTFGRLVGRIFIRPQPRPHTTPFKTTQHALQTVARMAATPCGTFGAPVTLTALVTELAWKSNIQSWRTAFLDACSEKKILQSLWEVHSMTGSFNPDRVNNKFSLCDCILDIWIYVPS